MQEKQTDITELESAHDIPNSDVLWNVCCYEYLRPIAQAIHGDLISRYPFIRKFRDHFISQERVGSEITLKPYDENVAYGDIYSDFLIAVEDILVHKERKVKEREGDEVHEYTVKYREGELDDIIRLIYVNPNLALFRAELIVNDICISDISETSDAFRHQVKKRLQGEGSQKRINKFNPIEEGGVMDKLATGMSLNYNPQAKTGMPSIRQYKYLKDKNLPVEIRLGTQVQREKSFSSARISPLYERWLDIEAAAEEGKLTHLYFNKMALSNRDDVKALLDLEKSHKSIAIITLPADRGMMEHKLVFEDSPHIVAGDAYAEMLTVALGKKKGADFHISNRVKSTIFVNRNKELEILSVLLKNSFAKMKFEADDVISQADLQAVYFDFINYQLTNYILEKLQPTYFNVTSKDGIDRGGVASTYFNLMKSIELSQPMSEEEFNRGLHAATLLVMGRAMNYRIDQMWNVINRYLIARNGQAPAGCEWLVKWRDKCKLKAHEEEANHDVGFHLKVLSKYISDMQDADAKKGLWGRLTGKGGKKENIIAAKRLMEAINGTSAGVFTRTDLKAFSQGELNKIYVSIFKEGYLSPIVDQAEFILKKQSGETK